MIVTDINILRNKSQPVESVEEAKQIINQLTEELNKFPGAVGLSAIQIGIAKQVAIVKSNNQIFNLINPVIVDLDMFYTFHHEGCLSFQKQYTDTRRAEGITIVNNVIEGDSFREEKQHFFNPQGSKDVTAVAVQHEIDHMIGVIFLDRKNTIIGESKKEVKIGRNDVCSCGSGKKYKKCCGK